MSGFDPFWLPQFHTFPHHWTVSLAKHSPVTFTNVLESVITLECNAGSGSPLYLMMQKRYETEVTNLIQNNPSLFAVLALATPELTFLKL